MMVLFRSSFIAAAVVCIVALGQIVAVCAAPQIGMQQIGVVGIRQIGMRPKLRVLGVEASGSDISSVLSPSATADVDGSAPSAILSPEATATAAPETEQPPDSSSSDDPGTNLAVQSNSAVVSSASRVGVALLAGSLAALILQTF